MAALKPYQMLINGEWTCASDRSNFESINPATNEPWCTFPEASEKDVDKAVKAAHEAFTNGPWSKMTPTERGHCLRKLGDLLAENSEKLGEIECIDTGKMFKETRWQAKYIAEFFHFFAGAADKINGTTYPIDKQDMFVFTLASGNTIVIKGSEHGAAVLLEFGKLIEEAGIPAGVVNIITGHGEPCGRALTSHPLVAKIAFTGGPEAAKHIIHNSAENFAPVSLELGGKSPFIVFDDANIESAVNGSVGGIFAATGQSCVAGSRLYLQDGIADEFIERMKEVAQSVVIGDPMAEDTQMGPLCTHGQLENIKREVANAQEEGGKVITGGKQPEGMKGIYYEPTMIECPRQDLRIVDTELFGPVLSVIRFKDEAEAIKLANDTKHGLAAGVFTKDNARAMRMTKALQAGIVWVNTYRVISPIAEFGGMKGSGYGREAGFQAMYEYSRAKTVWMNTSDEPLASQFVGR